MSEIKYKVAFMDGLPVEGTASKLFFKDDINILTILGGYAPLVAVLGNNGKLHIHTSGGKVQEYPYQEGFLKCEKNDVQITILKS